MIKRHRRLAAALVLGTALVATSCANADISGGGSLASSINPNAKQSGTFTFKTRSLCEDGSSGCDYEGIVLAGVNGTLRDPGTSDAFPHGVSISFTGKMPGGNMHSIAIGGAGYCDGLPMPESIAPAGAAPEEQGACFAGLVTYRSTDLKNYPNGQFSSCALFGDAANALLEGPSTKSKLSGLGLALLVDSNRNAKPDKGDGVAFVALCGPYANLQKANVDSNTPYNYATCPGGRVNTGNIITPGGVMTTPIDPILDEIDEFLYFLSTCTQPLRSGNLKITPLDSVPPSTVPISTTTFPY